MNINAANWEGKIERITATSLRPRRSPSLIDSPATTDLTYIAKYVRNVTTRRTIATTSANPFAAIADASDIRPTPAGAKGKTKGNARTTNRRRKTIQTLVRRKSTAMLYKEM